MQHYIIKTQIINSKINIMCVCIRYLNVRFRNNQLFSSFDLFLTLPLPFESFLSLSLSLSLSFPFLIVPSFFLLFFKPIIDASGSSNYRGMVKKKGEEAVSFVPSSFPSPLNNSFSKRQLVKFVQRSRISALL